jgi:26S proteasome regulatory subunit N1
MSGKRISFRSNKTITILLFFRHLATEIAEEWKTVEDTPAGNARQKQLLALASEIAPYHLAHNAEAEACDLLTEIEQLDLLKTYVDEETYARVCLYLVS